jgi:ADP-ribosylglycohydrolase
LYSDDTAMAMVIVDRLREQGKIDPSALAREFAIAYRNDPYRGYGLSVRRVLDAIAEGLPHREAAQAVFGGTGSMGNGGAMRVAPLGAYFADDLDLVAEQAAASAETTHAHPEGRAGAVAVAVAAAMSARGEPGRTWLEAARDAIATGETRKGLDVALGLGFEIPPVEAAAVLGNGQKITAPDTVPFALWCAARHRGEFEESLWSAVSVGGDNDTLGAIVGGIACLAAGPDAIPARWRSAREPLATPHFSEEVR